jgi:GTP-binding protein HflX
VVALVGYTNAGKSTLFNRLTGADVMAEDLLFATLDPTMRAVRLPGIDKAILSDTVGFISDLPTQLVAAFRATLEEVTAADVILHVRDMANPESDAQKREVMSILAELGLIAEEAGEPQVPLVEVWNKCDLLQPDQIAYLRQIRAARPDENITFVSAVSSDGCDDLRDLLGRLLTADARLHHFVLPASAGKKIAWLHGHGDVIEESEAGEGEEGPMRRIQVMLTPRELGRFSNL